MRTRTLCQNLEAFLTIDSSSGTRWIRNKSSSVKCLRTSRRAITTSTTRTIRNRVIDNHRNDDEGIQDRAQSQLETLKVEDFAAAPEIDFSKFKPNAQEAGSEGSRQNSKKIAESVLRTLRLLPVSPSYFTAKPRFTDDYLRLAALRRKYQTLPTVRPGDQPKVAWRDFETYQRGVGEPIRRSRYGELVENLRRMNMIHPTLMPDEVKVVLQTWARDIQPASNKAKPIEVDEFGRAEAIGKRKSSVATAWVVEGDGQVLINGMSIHKVFARIHDRESVLWSLKITNRMDKYNVFAIARGGGTTGQAEALTLAISKGLMAHEPDLKSVLRTAGCVARDPRRVERKKPGKKKARKMPTWVKR